MGDAVARLMVCRQQIRNLSFVGPCDSDFGILMDCFCGAGMFAEKIDERVDSREREPDRITAGMTLVFPQSNEYPETLINLIRPGNIESTSPFRLTDGLYIVVNYLVGICSETESLLRLALQEKIKIALIITKLDMLFHTENLEEAYEKMFGIIEKVNKIISTFGYNEEYLVCPLKGNVAFASVGINCWGFTLGQFTSFYSTKLSKNPSQVQKKLWGDQFVHKRSKNRWKSTKPKDYGSQGCEWERGFNELVLKPLKKVFEAASDWNVLNRMVERIGLHLTPTERLWHPPGEQLGRLIIQKWFPINPCLVAIANNHLPNPVDAQRSRLDLIYSGPLDSETASSIRDCDPNGPLTIFISSIVTTQNSRYLGFGRVFSGTMHPRSIVRIMGPEYIYGKTVDLFENVSLPTIFSLMPQPTRVNSVSAGNVIAILYIENYLRSYGTITMNEVSYPINNVIVSTQPLVKRAVSASKVSTPKPQPAAKSENVISYTVENSKGEQTIAASSLIELHRALRSHLDKQGEDKCTVAGPFVSYRETVIAESDLRLAISPNHHNKIFGKVSPLQQELIHEIQSGVIERDTLKLKTHLISKYNWDKHHDIWKISPQDENNCNILSVNCKAETPYINEINDSCGAAMEWICTEGALAYEPTHGIEFNIHNCTLHSDAIHRGGGQIIPTVRTLFYAAQLAASPRLLEPIFLVKIECSAHVAEEYCCLISDRRGDVLDLVPEVFGSSIVITANLPVADSLDFEDAVAKLTLAANPSLSMDFHHWKLVDSDPLEKGSYANLLVAQIRNRKGMRELRPIK